MKPDSTSKAVAVYCASLLGKSSAYHNAAVSLGRALADSNRPLVYGGGTKGIMGVVSGTVLEGGGKVTGVIPYAIFAGEGEGNKSETPVAVNGASREGTETIIVESMHERKVEMAKRVGGFIGLPGGFGTFEEVLEVTTWTQLGIHTKPVILLNVLSFWEPLRHLVRNGIEEGYISPERGRLLITFVDGPVDHREHETYDWGKAALQALDDWEGRQVEPLFDWSGGKISADERLAAT